LWLKGELVAYRAAARALPRLTYDDLMEDTFVRMVFVTASPVLTNEVKQYYADLKNKLASHLLKADKSKTEAGASTLDSEERKRLLTYLENKEKEIIQAETIQQQKQLPESYSLLQSYHFPLFLTVQRLVYMLDAALPRSFFSRNHTGRIIGMESSLGWHNEEQGVFMIN